MEICPPSTADAPETLPAPADALQTLGSLLRCGRCRDRPGTFRCSHCDSVKLCDLCLFSECADSARSLGMVRCRSCGCAWLEGDLHPHLRKSQRSDLLSTCSSAIAMAISGGLSDIAGAADAEIARLRAKLVELEMRRMIADKSAILRCERCLRVVPPGVMKCGECDAPPPVIEDPARTVRWVAWEDLASRLLPEDVDRHRAVYHTLTVHFAQEIALCLAHVDPVFASSFDWSNVRRVCSLRINGRVPPHLLLPAARLNGKTEDAIRREVRSFEVTCQIDFQFARILHRVLCDGVELFASLGAYDALGRVQDMFRSANAEFDSIGFGYRRKRYDIPVAGGPLVRVMYTHHANYLVSKRADRAPKD